MTDQIMHELGEIKGELRGINQRLDRQNGRIDKAEKDISTTKLTIAKATGVVVAGSAILAFTWNALYSWAKVKLGI